MKAFHYIDGKWVDGNPLVMQVWDHAMWLGAAVFDGARSFEGVAPDLNLHCQRTLRSAAALGLRSPFEAGKIEEIIREGIAKFPKGTPLYLRPFLWSKDGWMDPDPATTQIIITVIEYPMPDRPGHERRLLKEAAASPETRRPTPRPSASTRRPAAPAPRRSRAASRTPSCWIRSATSPSSARANLWIAKDGAAHTPCERHVQRHHPPARDQTAAQGRPPKCRRTPKDIHDADEVFMTGNYARSTRSPVEDRDLQPGPVYRKARELYWEFAHGG
jgi:branched-chain amino acid aminotransferase